MKKEFQIHELPEIVGGIVQKATELRTPSLATVIALSGDLGAGKTTLSRELAKQLGVEHSITSPTFVIMKQYPAHIGPWKTLVHIDAYRLNSTEELRKLSWQELCEDPQNLILIEWPEKVPEAIPAHSLRITLEHSSETIREIQY